MIEKIGFNFNFRNTLKKQENAQQKTESKAVSPVSQNTMTAPSTQLLHSYFVSFGKNKDYDTDSNDIEEKVIKKSSKSAGKDKMSEIENNLSYYGEKLFNDSKALAKKYKHNEITQLHVLRAGLANIKRYMDKLDSGEASYDDESSFSTHITLENDLGKTVFKDKTKRDIIRPVIENEITEIDKKLAELPAAKSSLNSKIVFSKDFLNDIYSFYTQDNVEDLGGDGLVHDQTIFEAAYYPNNDQIKKEIITPFRTVMKDEIQMDKRPLSQRIHLSFYDDKAVNIWKNLAVGTNMAILHDKDSSVFYLINSFLSVFENSKNGFGNLTKDNTVIVNFNDNGEIDNNYMNKKIHQFGKDKNKNYIMIMSIMDREMDSLVIDETNVEMFKKAPKNVKFVMVADKDKYYKESTSVVAQKFFRDFGEISMPLMNMTQAKKMFKEQPALTARIKKPFSQPAIEKCIEAANQLEGNFPEKAQKVMELVAAYYVDKDKISTSDVQNYVKEAKEIFKPVENDSSIKVVFDTGIKLKDMVGAPSTKKEAQSIVDRIKDKSIGTKGFIIYSQDGSVGAGRKYTAQAIAGEAKIPYIEINAVDFGTKDVDLFGFGMLSPEASMKKLFGMVKAQAETNPSKSALLFVENFDYFSYGEYVSEYHEKAMSQLIREMNKAQEQGLNIVVMGSMGDPAHIGAATSKSFKFIDQIEVESPERNSEARNEIIGYYIKKKNIKLSGNEQEQKEIKDHINLLTERLSYIEILTLMDKAKNVAKERKHKTIDKSDFTEAYLQLTTGRPSSAQDPQYRKELVTSHECGHATNGIIMEELARKEGRLDHIGDSINFITLDPRGSFGGAVYFSDEVNPEYSFEKIFSGLVTDFGGNSCEKHFYGQDGSWGITADMRAATHMASMATMLMGQGKHFGKKSLNGMWVLSEKDKDNMNKDIDTMLTNAQLVSDAITEVYEDFNKEFVKKYSSKVGTGECIIQREEFVKMLNDWRSKQSVEKQKEFELLDKTILDVIAATKRGVKCHKSGE